MQHHSACACKHCTVCAAATVGMHAWQHEHDPLVCGCARTSSYDYEPCPRARADNLGTVGRAAQRACTVLGADPLHMDWGRPVGGVPLAT